jgi:hypothetical protein
MVGARLEYCTKWQQMASAQESNNQIAIEGSRWPTEKIVARQLTDRAGQKKNRGGNQGIAPAKRKKTAAQQSMDCAGQKSDCSVAIDGLRRPKEQNSGAAIRVSCRPLEKLRQGNRGIAPAS